MEKHGFVSKEHRRKPYLKPVLGIIHRSNAGKLEVAPENRTG
jgi:hypothetical protein